MDTRDKEMFYTQLEKQTTELRKLNDQTAEQIAISRKLNECMQEQSSLLAAVVKLLISAQADRPDTTAAAAIREAKNTLNDLGYGSHFLRN